MGDRALVFFHDEKSYSPCIYLHWNGTDVAEWLPDLAKLMRTRTGDVEYSAARFIGLCAARHEGATGLGTWNAPEAESFDEFRKKVLSSGYSHGDAGVFLVNVDDWSVETAGGYGLGEEPEHYTLDVERDVWELRKDDDG